MKHFIFILFSIFCNAQTDQYKEILLSKKIGKKVQSYKDGFGEIYDSKTRKESIVDSLGNITFNPEKGNFIHLNKNKFIYYVKEKNDRKTALIDEKGNQLIPLDYQEFDAFWNSDTLLVLTKNKMQALYDFEGNQIIPFNDEINLVHSERVFVKNGEDWFLYDDSGNKISDRKFSDYTYFENGKALINGSSGNQELIDSNGITLYRFSKKIVSVIDKDFHFFETENLQNQKKGMIDDKGNILVDEVYDDILRDFISNEGNYIFLKRKEGTDVFSKKEYKIYPTDYNYLNFIYGSYFSFIDEKLNKHGLINLENQIVFQPDFEMIRHFEIGGKNYLYLKKGIETQLLDEQLNSVFSSDYQIVSIYSDSVFLKKGNQYFKNEFIDQKLTLLEDIASIKEQNYFAFGPIYKYSYPMVFQKSDKKWGIMNGRGNIIIPAIYDEIISFGNSENQIVVKDNGKYGVINYENEPLKEILYDRYEWRKESLVLEQNKVKEYLDFSRLIDFSKINEK